MHTRPVSLGQAPEAYRIFRDKKDECPNVVLKP
jgi:threonine dehydrogenase-like Zn-dependent dehydrogenase